MRLLSLHPCAILRSQSGSSGFTSNLLLTGSVGDDRGGVHLEALERLHRVGLAPGGGQASPDLGLRSDHVRRRSPKCTPTAPGHA